MPQTATPVAADKLRHAVLDVQERAAAAFARDLDAYRAARPPHISLEIRSRACGSGLPVGAFRRIGRAFIRGRKWAVGGCRGWCGLIEYGREKTQGGQALDGTCSPRVEVTLASVRQAYLRRRNRK